MMTFSQMLTRVGQQEVVTLISISEEPRFLNQKLSRITQRRRPKSLLQV